MIYLKQFPRVEHESFLHSRIMNAQMACLANQSVKSQTSTFELMRKLLRAISAQWVELAKLSVMKMVCALLDITRMNSYSC